ncbi:sulfite exporter TauE/SafE family protein [Agaribacterium haliotis]|uniref:sulfite exporter TauE/SafE family protein n=1 Tax=Agaribacterium haliotis TaxID=2013869 RepID=UPI000BB581F2|nr:sulfite exporter TauE/SafE family protein [Agaribacterium haliotis]
MDLAEQLILLAVALVSNALSAMAGGGAGLLQLPALIFLGLPFTLALATHKVATVALGIGASLKHARSGNLAWAMALTMLAAGLPGVVLGANCILKVPAALAQSLLGLLTMGLGIYSIYKKKLGQHYAPRNRDLKGLSLGALGLFCLGFFNGSLTSGTGLFVTTWLIAWYGFDFKRATAYTMILVGLFWNGSGALTLALLTEVKWEWLPMLILGSLLGGYLGAHWAVTYGNSLIKRVFELVTIATGLSLLLKSAGLI